MTNEEEFKDHLTERKQEATNHGVPELEQYASATLPTSNFEIIGVTDDILLCEYDDCNSDGNEIERDGIWMNIDITKALYRSAVVLMVGENVSPRIKVGDRIAFPNDKGIPAVQLDSNGAKRNIVLLNESRVFFFLAPKKED